jgi:hypothetical protein
VLWQSFFGDQSHVIGEAWYGQTCACTPIGKVKKVSNVYRPGTTPVWTEYEYDEVGRVNRIIQPPNTGTTGSSGGTVYEYTQNNVKVTDPAGKWKTFTLDAFGNVTWVEEPRPGGNVEPIRRVE